MKLKFHKKKAKWIFWRARARISCAIRLAATSILQNGRWWPFCKMAVSKFAHDKYMTWHDMCILNKGRYDDKGIQVHSRFKRNWQKFSLMALRLKPFCSGSRSSNLGNFLDASAKTLKISTPLLRVLLVLPAFRGSNRWGMTWFFCSELLVAVLYGLGMVQWLWCSWNKARSTRGWGNRFSQKIELHRHVFRIITQC